MSYARTAMYLRFKIERCSDAVYLANRTVIANYKMGVRFSAMKDHKSNGYIDPNRELLFYRTAVIFTIKKVYTTAMNASNSAWQRLIGAASEIYGRF